MTGMLNRREFAAALSATTATSTLVTGRHAIFQTADAAREVEQLERQLVTAISTVDLTTYDRIVADDYVVVQASGVELTKADVMTSYRSGTRRFKDLRLSEVKVHLYGDTAVLAARSTGLRRENDRDVPNDVRYIRIYLRRRGRWRAVGQMATPIPSA